MTEVEENLSVIINNMINSPTEIKRYSDQILKESNYKLSLRHMFEMTQKE